MGNTPEKQGSKQLLGHQSQVGWQPRKSISAVLAGLVLFAIGATALTSYWIVRNLILSSLKENAQAQVQKSGDEIDEWLSSLLAEVQTIANNDLVRSLDWSKAEPYVQLELNRSPDFHMFVLANADGSYYTTKVGRAKANLKDRTHFQRALAGETFVDNPVVSKTTGIRQVNIAAPIWSLPPLNRKLKPEQAEIRAKSLAAFQLPTDPSATPRPIGELAAPVAVERISEVIAKTSLGKGSYAFALDSKGVPIAHPNKILIDQAQSFLKDSDPALATTAKAMVADQRGITLEQLGGKWVYIVYMPLRNANWSLALVIPRANLEQKLVPLNLLASVLGLLLLIAMIIAVKKLQSFEQTRIRATREILLNRLTTRIRESLDLNTILQTTVDELAHLLKLDRVNFSWYHPEHKQLEVVCEQQTAGYCLLRTISVTDLGDLGDRLHQRQLVCVQDTTDAKLKLSESVQQAYQELGIRSYLAIPIDIEGELPGYLMCIRTTPQKWGDDQIELLQEVAGQLIIGIRQSRLYAQTQEQVTLVSNQAEKLKETLTELQKTQAQLIQTEKMSSLGQMVAGVAHEINNPVNFIHGNLSHVSQYTEDLLGFLQLYQQTYPNPTGELQAESEQIDLEFLLEDLPKTLTSMKVGTERIRQIVLSLRNFSRLDEADMKPVNIHEGIDSTLLLLQNKLAARNGHSAIQVVKEYGNLPAVECYAGQLNQVLMNIISNAADALDQYSQDIVSTDTEKFTPTIRVRTDVLEDNSRIVIRIADNGPGMSESVRSRLFDPFFTTKPVGQGTGLGLSISYQIIVEKHNGVLKCFSEPGQGAEFWLEIPIHPSPVNLEASQPKVVSV